MNTNRSRDWLQVIGQYGVIASLLFVGLQIRQDHQIAQSVAYQQRTTSAAEFYWIIGSDPIARSAMEKTLIGETDLTDEETLIARWFWRSGKELLQNSYYQYQIGFLDEEHWMQVRNIIKTAIAQPVARSILLDGNTRPSFQALLDEIQAEVNSESDR